MTGLSPYEIEAYQSQFSNKIRTNLMIKNNKRSSEILQNFDKLMPYNIEVNIRPNEIEYVDFSTFLGKIGTQSGTNDLKVYIYTQNELEILLLNLENIYIQGKHK